MQSDDADNDFLVFALAGVVTGIVTAVLLVLVVGALALLFN